MPDDHPVLNEADKFRQELLRGERERASRMVRAYGRIYQAVQDEVAGLVAELEQAGELGEMPAWQVAKLERLQHIQRDVEERLIRFGAYANEEIGQGIEAAVQMGLGHSQSLVETAFHGIRITWNQLPAEAVEAMIAFLEESAPLRQALISQLGPEVAQGVAERLITGIALGYNPRKIAAIIRRELGVGLNWALRTARTAQLWAYRAATLAHYRANSHVVKGWIWSAQLDTRVCLACVMMHGTRHGLDEVLDDHHNGRCAMIPITATWQEIGLPGVEEPPLPIVNGREWFEGLPAAQQREMLGKARYAAWKAGEFDLAALVTKHDDPVYGPMTVENSLVGMIGDRADEYYP